MERGCNSEKPNPRNSTLDVFSFIFFSEKGPPHVSLSLFALGNDAIVSGKTHHVGDSTRVSLSLFPFWRGGHVRILWLSTRVCDIFWLWRKTSTPRNWRWPWGWSTWRVLCAGGCRRGSLRATMITLRPRMMILLLLLQVCVLKCNLNEDKFRFLFFFSCFHNNRIVAN